MFGKGGGPLNAWIKEFCELVFIQTLQAFIFALVISFVLNIMTYQTNLDATDRNTSLGIICIVALTSIFKVEEIARRIFGYGPTKADHGNAVQSIGKSMMALKMGKNVLDNGRKIVSGAGAAIGAHSKKVKAYKRYTARMEALNKDNDNDNDNDAPTLSSGVSSNSQKNSDAVSEKQKLLDQAQEKRNESINKRKEAQKIRKSSPSKMSKRDREEAARKLENEAFNIDLNARNLEEKDNAMKGDADFDKSATANTNGNTNTNVSKSTGKKKSGDYNQKALQIKDDLDDKLDEIKKQRHEGIKKMVSGVAETGAAMVGFTAGTAMGAASTNDWGSAVKDGITWAGTADAVTAGAIDLTDGALKFIGNRANNLNKLRKEFADELNKANMEAQINTVKDVNTKTEQMTDDFQKDINEMQEEAQKDAEKEFQQASERAEKNARRTTSAGPSSTVSKSTSKRNKTPSTKSVAFGRVIQNHSVGAQKQIAKAYSGGNSATRQLNDIYKQNSKSTPPRANDIDKNVFN